MSRSNCCFLTCIQVSQETGKVIWYSNFFKNFPQFVVIHMTKGSSVVSEAKVDVFLELSCLFDDSMDAGNLVSDSSAFSKSSWDICKFSVHVLLKLSLKDFEHYFASMWDECNCTKVWTFFGIAFFWGLEWKLTFSSPVATAQFSKFAGILSATLSHHHILGLKIAQLEFHHLH